MIYNEGYVVVDNFLLYCLGIDIKLRCYSFGVKGNMEFYSDPRYYDHWFECSIPPHSIEDRELLMEYI